MTDRPGKGRGDISVYDVDVASGKQQVVSIVEPELVFAHGLCQEAILGVLIPGVDDVPGSYRHNPNHRLLTTDGFFRLPTELVVRLRANVLCSNSSQGLRLIHSGCWLERWLLVVF